MANYTAPDGTVYTSPEVARQYGVVVPENISSGIPIQQQTQAANAILDRSSLISNPNQIISPNQIAPTQALNLPGLENDTTVADMTASGGSETAKAIQATIKDLTLPETDLDKQQSKLMGEIESLLPETQGRGEAQLAGEEQAGIPALKKELSNINAQLLAKVAEYETAYKTLEGQGRGIPTNIIRGQQAVLRNQQGSDIALLNARAQGLQGNIQAAQQSVDRSVDLRYADVEDKLNVKIKQLELLQPLLNKQEKIQAEAMNRQYTEQKEKLAEEKAQAKSNLNLSLAANVQTNFVNRNGEFYDARTGKPFGTAEEFLKAAGVKDFNEAYKKGLVTDVGGQRLADIDFVTQARVKYPDAGIVSTDSPEMVEQKLQNSRLYRKDTYIAPTGGGSGGGLSPYQTITATNSIQDNARQDPDISIFTNVRGAFEQARQAKNQQNSAGDIVLMRTIAKITDPTSSVREEEFATFKDAQGALPKYGVQMTKGLVGKGQLTPEGRTALMNQIQNIYNQRKAAYDSKVNYYQSQAQAVGGSIPFYVAPEMEGGQTAEQFRAEAQKQGYSPEEINAYLKSKGLQ